MPNGIVVSVCRYWDGRDMIVGKASYLSNTTRGSACSGRADPNGVRRTLGDLPQAFPRVDRASIGA